MAARHILSTISVLFLAGSAVLLFFLLLAGVRDSVPLNELYWIQFDTNSIQSSLNLPNPVRWTSYNYCGVNSDGHNSDCTKTKAAFPFTPQDAFDTTSGIPQDFITHRRTYYYLTRIAYGFFIGVLFFDVVALAFTALACCSKLGAGLVSSFTFIAFVFAAAAAAMQTAAFVKGKNQLNDLGYNAKIGVKMIAFTWTIVALLFLTWLLMSIACCSKGRGEAGSGWSGRRRKSSAAVIDPVTGEPQAKRGFFNFSRKNNVEGEQKNYASSFERSDPPPPPLSNAGFFKTNRRKDNDASSYYAENAPIAPPHHNQVN